MESRIGLLQSNSWSGQQEIESPFSARYCWSSSGRLCRWPSFSWLSAIKKMEDCQHGMTPPHSRTGVTNDLPDLLTPVLSEAMNRAVGARRCVVTKGAPMHPTLDIGPKGITSWRQQRPRWMSIPDDISARRRTGSPREISGHDSRPRALYPLHEEAFPPRRSFTSSSSSRVATIWVPTIRARTAPAERSSSLAKTSTVAPASH